eukprot:1161906-Pelagomonas_calceolata.AAC.4
MPFRNPQPSQTITDGICAFRPIGNRSVTYLTTWQNEHEDSEQFCGYLHMLRMHAEATLVREA